MKHLPAHYLLTIAVSLALIVQQCAPLVVRWFA